MCSFGGLMLVWYDCVLGLLTAGLLIGLVCCVCNGLLGVSFMSLALCFAFVSYCFDLLGVCSCCLLERVVGSLRFDGFDLVIVWFVMPWDDLGLFYRC